MVREIKFRIGHKEIKKKASDSDSTKIIFKNKYISHLPNDVNLAQ